jgi:hypothetical protein
MQLSSSLNMKPKPKMRGWGGRKFFLPRIMKEPAGCVCGVWVRVCVVVVLVVVVVVVVVDAWVWLWLWW